MYKSFPMGKTRIEGVNALLPKGTIQFEGRKRFMRKDRKNIVKKERIIMIASSVFVLSALTLTGVYMKNQESKSKSDGYTIDFSALEKEAEQNSRQNAQKQLNAEEANRLAMGEKSELERGALTENDLDYLPMEETALSQAGSRDITIPGVTSEKTKKPDTKVSEPVREESQSETEITVEETTTNEETDVTGASLVVTNLHFSNKLLFPVNGEVLIPYSMDSSVYFRTLDQYKYNPAIIYSTAEGVSVTACAEGQIKDILDDPQLGHMLVMDLGDGYEAVYGQIKDITYGVGSFVDAGTSFASVAAPTKYFSTEGTNLYFQIKKDGVPVDPNQFFGR